MKNKRIIFLVLISICAIFVSAGCDNPEKSKKLKLWYNHPAVVWEEALPLGNGRIGAMIFGSPQNELIQLNENTLWSGHPVDGNNPKAAEMLPAIRQAVNDGDYKKAAGLWKNNAQGPYSARYLPMADLHIVMTSIGEVTDFYRDLDISDALSATTFKSGGVAYKRTSFISYPDQVMVVRLEADKKESLNFNLSLNSRLRYKTDIKNDNYLILTGKAPPNMSLIGL